MNTSEVCVKLNKNDLYLHVMEDEKLSLRSFFTNKRSGILIDLRKSGLSSSNVKKSFSQFSSLEYSKKLMTEHGVDVHLVVKARKFSSGGSDIVPYTTDLYSCADIVLHHDQKGSVNVLKGHFY